LLLLDDKINNNQTRHTQTTKQPPTSNKNLVGIIQTTGNKTKHKGMYNTDNNKHNGVGIIPTGGRGHPDRVLE
jgi:hypothetical protein